MSRRPRWSPGCRRCRSRESRSWRRSSRTNDPRRRSRRRAIERAAFKRGLAGRLRPVGELEETGVQDAGETEGQAPVAAQNAPATARFVDQGIDRAGRSDRSDRSSDCERRGRFNSPDRKPDRENHADRDRGAGHPRSARPPSLFNPHRTSSPLPNRPVATLVTSPGLRNRTPERLGYRGAGTFPGPRSGGRHVASAGLLASGSGCPIRSRPRVSRTLTSLPLDYHLAGRRPLAGRQGELLPRSKIRCTVSSRRGEWASRSSRSSRSLSGPRFPLCAGAVYAPVIASQVDDVQFTPLVVLESVADGRAERPPDFRRSGGHETMGWLALDTDPEVRISASALGRTPNGEEVVLPLPILSPQQAVPGGGTASLVGMRRGRGVHSHLYLASWEKGTNACTIEVRRPPGHHGLRSHDEHLASAGADARFSTSSRDQRGRGFGVAPRGELPRSFLRFRHGARCGQRRRAARGNRRPAAAERSASPSRPQPPAGSPWAPRASRASVWHPWLDTATTSREPSSLRPRRPATRSARSFR